MKNGFLLINKSPGSTSHDVIDDLRKIIGIKKIGHAGTLDPFANGLLLIAIGEATKLLRHYVGLDKEYVATLKLGAISDAYDRTGKITKRRFASSADGQATVNRKPTKQQIEKILKSFVGKQKQLPPMHSAKKVGGQRLYKLARLGQEVKRDKQDVEIYSLQLTTYNYPLLTVRCSVSSGTYIRALAHDIGQRLGVGAYLEKLERTSIGDFKLEDACPSMRRGEAGGNPNNARGVDKIASCLAGRRAARQGRRAVAPSLGLLRNDINKSNWEKYLIPMKTILVTGTFDGVHEGHKNYFSQARKLGHRLFAIVSRDKVTKKIKGSKPKYSEKERLKMVKACPEIDRVYLGVLEEQPQPSPCPLPRGERKKTKKTHSKDERVKAIFDFVASLKPDVIALGYDQKAYTKNLKQEMKKRGLDVEVKRLKSFLPTKFKNSIINSGVDKNSKKS